MKLHMSQSMIRQQKWEPPGPLQYEVEDVGDEVALQLCEDDPLGHAS